MNNRSIASNIKLKIRGFLTIISPRLNTKVTYYRCLHKKINLKNPKTFNEKVSWLKLNEYKNNELVKKCADKYRVREYIEKKGCAELLIPLLGVYDNEKDVEWERLPNQFALKLNCGCGCNLICTNKSKLDFDEIKKTMKAWRKEEYYLHSAEYQYKNVKKKFIIEKCLPIHDGKLPVDYKFYCIDGKCVLIMLCTDREIGNGANFFYFDREWNLLTEEEGKENQILIKKPERLDEAIKYAEKLAEDFKVVRVDLFLEENKIYFGELTFTPAAGMDDDLELKPISLGMSLDEWLGKMVKDLS